MGSVYLKNIIRFFFLVFFQVLILNNIRFGGYINPYFYIYFILLLPFDTPRLFLMLASFILGLTIDLFVNTPGLNAAACVFMAFSRPFVIRSISTGTAFQPGSSPSLNNQGIKWFAYYSVILVLLHHFLFFYLEVFRLSEFFHTFARVIFSSIFTLLLIWISEYLFYKREK